MTFYDHWDDGEETEVIERNPQLVTRHRVESFVYSPPPAGRHDNDRPTLTEVAAIGDSI